MFFQKQAIEKHLTCELCQDLFDDPRMLPCGHTFCNKCLLKRQNRASQQLYCPDCQAIHDVKPGPGFPINFTVNKLCDVQASEVNQSHKIKQLKQKLKLIDSKHKALAKSLRVGDNEIQSYCASLRNKIDLFAESRIEEIRQLHKNYTNQVNEYEKECMKSYGHSAENIFYELEPFLSSICQFWSETTSILSQFEVEDEEVNILVESSNDYLKQIETKERMLTSLKFNGKLMTLEQESTKLDSSCLGQIDYKVLTMKQANLKLSLARRLDFEAPSNKILTRAAYCLSYTYLYAAYKVKSHVELIIYDTIIGDVDSVTIQLRNSSYGSPIECSVSSLLHFKEVCVAVMRIKNVSQHYHKGFHLILPGVKPFLLPYDTATFFVRLGEECVYEKHLAITHESELQAANSTRLFCMNQAQRKVWVYRSDLVDDGDHFTQNIPAQARAMQANDKHLFILHTDSGHMELRAIDIKTKSISQEIRMPSMLFSQLKLVGTDYLFVFNGQENRFLLMESKSFVVRVQDQHVDELEENNLFVSSDDSPFVVFFNSNKIASYFTVEND